MNKVFLIEDHDEALEVWRKEKAKGLDLVHFDAHLDFGVYEARPPEKVFAEAKSVKELVRGLEKSIVFTRYEQDFNKQTNIGNYIYPAISEGIVKNFYWVIPGCESELKKSAKMIKEIVRAIGERTWSFNVCTLDNLPLFTQETLLDIDVDYLVIDSIKNANNTDNIGRRSPWIKPRELVLKIREKITSPLITTISYSVNGGWTPMKYKHLGDEIAYHIAPEKFEVRYNKNLKAANFFNLFLTTQSKIHYKNAIKLNPSYRAGDNNYGALYQLLAKHALARREYEKILRVDPKNPVNHIGLGDMALLKKDFKSAKKHFSAAASGTDGQKIFSECKKRSLFGLAKAEFGLKNYDGAKKLFIKCKALDPLNPHCCFMLGQIFEKQREYSHGASLYRDSVRLGLGGIEPLSKLLKLSRHVGERAETLRFIKARFVELEKNFRKEKRLSVKKGKRNSRMKTSEKKLLILKEKIFTLAGVHISNNFLRSPPRLGNERAK